MYFILKHLRLYVELSKSFERVFLSIYIYLLRQIRHLIKFHKRQKWSFLSVYKELKKKIIQSLPSPSPRGTHMFKLKLKPSIHIITAEQQLSHAERFAKLLTRFVWSGKLQLPTKIPRRCWRIVYLVNTCQSTPKKQPCVN